MFETTRTLKNRGTIGNRDPEILTYDEILFSMHKKMVAFSSDLHYHFDSIEALTGNTINIRRGKLVYEAMF